MVEKEKETKYTRFIQYIHMASSTVFETEEKSKKIARCDFTSSKTIL